MNFPLMRRCIRMFLSSKMTIKKEFSHQVLLDRTPLSSVTVIAAPVKKGTKKHGKVHRQGKRKEARYP
jgi:hypothetical protein